ncbi:MAG: aromatic amino acid ammonia-lyase [Patescibacteria group bacterium]
MKNNARTMVEKGGVIVDGENLSIQGIVDALSGVAVTVSPRALKNMADTRATLLAHATDRPIYGVNTGFGPMVRHIISSDDLSALQYNLVRGHAVGMGVPIKESFAFAAMLIRLNTLVKGMSCASPALAQKLTALINQRVVPVIPEHGAVGTSGDLVQLAHIALTLLGEGNVFYEGKIIPTKAAFKKVSLTPHVLGPKEGLSLINGTSVMTAIAALLVREAEHLVTLSARVGALSLEIVQGFTDILDGALHEARPHPGQIYIAELMRKATADSKRMRAREHMKKYVQIQKETYATDIVLQEVYSMRCIPQILGPAYETIQNAKRVVEIEMNSVTDNPILDKKTTRFLHGGNFHGDYVATAVDHMKVGLAKITMLSERRVNYFLNKNVNHSFAPFLNMQTPGLSMGLQGLQFVATSTTALNQSLGYPHSLHSIPTNGDNQDVVSMGTDAALITAKVTENAYTVLAIEMVTLAQAVDLLGIEKMLSTSGRELYRDTRAQIKAVIADRTLTTELNNLADSLRPL